MTTHPNPTAREMAEKCARQFYLKFDSDETSCFLNDRLKWITDLLLHELNLEELLRDRERLDWLDEHSPSQSYHSGWIIQEGDEESDWGLVRTTMKTKGVRQAIDSAIDSQWKEGEK